MIPVLLILAFTFLSALHVYWAAGGRWGWLAALPESNGKPRFLPSKPMTAAVAVALLFCALLIAALAGFLSASFLPGARILGHLLSAVLLLRAIGDFRFVGLFKWERGSRFARLDTLLYSPIALALSLGVQAVLRSGKA